MHGLVHQHTLFFHTDYSSRQITYHHHTAMDRPPIALPSQPSKARKFSWVKKLMNNTSNPKDSILSPLPSSSPVSTSLATAASLQFLPITSTHRREIPSKVSKNNNQVGVDNSFKALQFYDVPNTDNDEIVSYVSTVSNNSNTLRNHDFQQRQFYAKSRNDENIDGTSVSTAACQLNVKVKNNNTNNFNTLNPNINYDRYSFTATNDLETNSSIKSLYSGNVQSVYSNNTGKFSKHILPILTPNYTSINTQLYSQANNQSSSTCTQNASMINNVDVTSALSDTNMDDNVSTKPILSLSSDEEDEDDDVQEIKSIRFQYDDYAQPLDNLNHAYAEQDARNESIKYFDNDDNLDDDVSFDIRSRYPPSHTSTAITSMSLLTSPLLTTINSQNTTQTNTNATAASIMTLASSSRHVAI